MTVNARRAERISKRTGHNAHDSNCLHWAGDFAGVDLNAVCGPCQVTPPSDEEYYCPYTVWVMRTGDAVSCGRLVDADGSLCHEHAPLAQRGWRGFLARLRAARSPE